MKIDKKASLQLSINAIVILVMAMVVLGLGLGFIRGLFGQGTEGLAKTLDNSQLQNPASADKPVTIDRTIKIRSGGSTNIDIGYFNEHNLESTLMVSSSTLTCVPNTGVAGGSSFTLAFPPGIKVDPGESVGIRAIISDTANVGAGSSHVCTFTIDENNGGILGSKPVQLYVEVTS